MKSKLKDALRTETLRTETLKDVRTETLRGADTLKDVRKETLRGADTLKDVRPETLRTETLKDASSTLKTSQTLPGPDAQRQQLRTRIYMYCLRISSSAKLSEEIYDCMV